MRWCARFYKLVKKDSLPLVKVKIFQKLLNLVQIEVGPYLNILYSRMADFAISQDVPDVPDHVLIIRTRVIFLSDFYQFGIKISGRCVCFSWCTLMCTILSIVSEISWLLQVARNFFWRVYESTAKGQNYRQQTTLH